MIVTLRPMTADELAARWPTLVEEYALDLHRSRGMPPDEARAASERQTAELLPDGVDTERTLLFVAESDGADVGWLWLGLPPVRNRPDTAWVFNIEVAPEHRGRGHGRAIMRAAEEELARRGVTRLGLNVFGHNPVARRLYESLGFEVTSQQMAKPIGGQPIGGQRIRG